MSIAIDKVDKTSRKKKNEHAYPGIVKDIIISIKNVAIKLICTASTEVSYYLSTNMILRSSINNEQTVTIVMAIWKYILEI